jgi:hypothetical protein
MEKTFMMVMSLYFVINLTSSDKGLVTTLQTGKVVTLSKSNESYEYYSKLLIHALERVHPVGLIISEDTIIFAVERADNDFIEKIVAKDEKTFVIQFQGHDGFFYLERNNTFFDRIYATLDRSRVGSQRVWFIADPVLRILDALLVEE